MLARLTLPGIFLLLVVGCRNSNEPASSTATRDFSDVSADAGGCPINTDVTGMILGKSASYSAKRYRSGVMIHAKGENSTGGWENRLHASKKDIFPTRFEFYQKAPAGIVNQLVTPFDVCVFYPTRQNFESVTVSDAEGEHTVKVED